MFVVERNLGGLESQKDHSIQAVLVRGQVLVFGIRFSAMCAGDLMGLETQLQGLFDFDTNGQINQVCDRLQLPSTRMLTSVDLYRTSMSMYYNIDMMLNDCTLKKVALWYLDRS